LQVAGESLLLYLQAKACLLLYRLYDAEAIATRVFVVGRR
jgi:hypothetical protein